MNTSLAQVLEAHGGQALWQSLRTIDIDMAASGFLFTAKRIPTTKRLRLSMDVTRPGVTMHDYPLPGHQVRMGPDGAVSWFDGRQSLLEHRAQPRLLFGQIRRQWRWDVLDFGYFCSYAMWNYLTMPWLLAQHAKVLQERRDSRGRTTLTVRMADGLPTHSPVQRFCFGPDWHLMRHDYTAEVVGAWAMAAHICADYKSSGGMAYASRRRVYPTLLGMGPLPWPTLVALDIVSLSVQTAQ